MLEERFARQHLCGPPPEFLLASSYTGIVRYLSGLNVRALTQPVRKASRLARVAPAPLGVGITRVAFATP